MNWVEFDWAEALYGLCIWTGLSLKQKHMFLFQKKRISGSSSDFFYTANTKVRAGVVL
jgi:hypothetical protein